MKRRNVDLGKIRKMKRNKITDVYGSNTLLYIKFLFLWAIVITADFMLEFRFEFLWPFWLLLRSVHDSFKYKGLAFSVLFVCIAITSDLVCLFFIPVHWLFFAASTYVWVQYVWHTDKGICLPTIILWMLFVYLEAAIRWKDNRHMPHLDLCRPFAAHCIGYPVVTLGFGFKSYVGYRMRQRKQREVAKENEFYMQLLQQALPQDETTSTTTTTQTTTTATNDSTQDRQSQQQDIQKDPVSAITNNHNNNHKNVQTNTKSYNTNVNGHVGISTASSTGTTITTSTPQSSSSTITNQSNGINHNNQHNNTHKTHRKSLDKDKFDSTNHNNQQHINNNNNSNYLYNNKTGSTTKVIGQTTGTYNHNNNNNVNTKDNFKLNDIISTQRDHSHHNHHHHNNKIEQIDKTTGVLLSATSLSCTSTEKLSVSLSTTDYQKCDYKNNITISEYQNDNINDNNLINNKDKILNHKQNGNLINNYDNEIQQNQTQQNDTNNDNILHEKCKGRKNRLKLKDNHHQNNNINNHNNTTAASGTTTTTTITGGITSSTSTTTGLINQPNDIIINNNNNINYISQYQQTLPQICEQCLRLDNDNKKIKTDLNHLKHIENDLRQKIDTNINYKNCLQVKQKENDELDKRIIELTNSRQLDRQNIQNSERRLIDERRQRQSIESQLNNERKQRKLIEERAVRTECGELCKMKKLQYESECNKLRRELQIVDDAKNTAEHQSRNYEQELRKMENEIRNREAQQGTEVLMSALAAMQDKNTTLEKNLSAETRVKLDLFSALGEAKRQLEIRESAIRNKDKEVHDLKAKIAQLLAVMPIHQMPTDSLCLSGSTSSMLRLNDTLLPSQQQQQQQHQQQQQQQQQQQCCPSSSTSSSSTSSQMSHQLGLSGLGQLGNLGVLVTNTSSSSSSSSTTMNNNNNNNNNSSSSSININNSSSMNNLNNNNNNNNNMMMMSTSGQTSSSSTSSLLDPNATAYTPKNSLNSQEA